MTNTSEEITWSELERALYNYYFRSNSPGATTFNPEAAKEQERRGIQIIEWLIDAWETERDIVRVRDIPGRSIGDVFKERLLAYEKFLREHEDE